MTLANGQAWPPHPLTMNCAVIQKCSAEELTLTAIIYTCNRSQRSTRPLPPQSISPGFLTYFKILMCPRLVQKCRDILQKMAKLSTQICSIGNTTQPSRAQQLDFSSTNSESRKRQARKPLFPTWYILKGGDLNCLEQENQRQVCLQVKNSSLLVCSTECFSWFCVKSASNSPPQFLLRNSSPRNDKPL